MNSLMEKNPGGVDTSLWLRDGRGRSCPQALVHYIARTIKAYVIKVEHDVK